MTRPMGSDDGHFPRGDARPASDVMSINLLLENDTDPVVWRGPIIAGTVKQFWTDVIWGDVDYHVRGHASGNGRRAADGVPVPAGGRHHHRGHPRRSWWA